MVTATVTAVTPFDNPDPLFEQHFRTFRDDAIGIVEPVDTPYGQRPSIYADYTATGKATHTVEDAVEARILPFLGNSHSSDSAVGTYMTEVNEAAHQIVRQHVNAGPGDVAIFKGAGMTGAVHWFQDMLDLRAQGVARPIVFVTRMEHHSNHLSWVTKGAEVVLVDQENGVPSLDHLDALCRHYKGVAPDRPLFGSFTACSNVTGIRTKYHEMAAIMHEFGGACFVDFAASAPYSTIDMHPADPSQRLDAVFFSPHKFLGGPGASGVVVFDRDLYKRTIPVATGGGVVTWTNPEGGCGYVRDIAERESPGSPNIIANARAAYALKTKELMDPHKIHARENLLVARAFDGLLRIDGVHVLEATHRQRQGILSFVIDNLPHGFVTKLLNDEFGIQARGGRSCAGTYGHYLFGIDREASRRITDRIDLGDMSTKPGWVRISLHPIMLDEEVDAIVNAIAFISKKGSEWMANYVRDPVKDTWIRRHSASSPKREGAEVFRIAM